MYASSDRFGAFVEVLARFRPDPLVSAGLESIDGEWEGALQPGELPAEWLDRRVIGAASLSGAFVDVGHSDSLACLRVALARQIVHHGLADFDASTIRLTAPRPMTQAISRYVYDQTSEAGLREFAGITYRSRLGDQIRNWALFEPVALHAATELLGQQRTEPIDRSDPDFTRALELHRVTLTEA